MEKYQVESKKKSALRISCQTPGVVLSLRVDFVLPLSQEKQQEEQQEPSPKSSIIPIHAKLLTGV